MRALSWWAFLSSAILLAACSGQSPEPSSSPSPSVSETLTTSSSPSVETSSPSPTPTQALDADQAAARDVVLELFRLVNEYAVDHSLRDYNPLVNITRGDAQWQVIDSVDRDRQEGVIQTAASEIRIITVSEIETDDESQESVEVLACVDASGVDVVDVDTKESVLSDDRNPISLFTLDVVRVEDAWIVNDIAGEPTDACQ